MTPFGAFSLTAQYLTIDCEAPQGCLLATPTSRQ